MNSDKEATELYRRYRPTSFKRMVGQQAAVATLETHLQNGNVPKAILLVGPSGTGKTTLARIMAKKVGCDPIDLVEVNVAQDTGIDLVRGIRNRMMMAPTSGPCRCWILDECHRATSQAQGALLGILEDTPAHVHFFLCTTDPGKLLKTIITRCTEIKLAALSAAHLDELVRHVLTRESKELTDPVVERLVEYADGSARKALVLLHQVLGLEGEEAQLEGIVKGDSRRLAIDLARALFDYTGKTQWPAIARMLLDYDGDPEEARLVILGYARKIFLGGGGQKERAGAIIAQMRANCRDGGHAELALMCWDAVVK